MVSGVVSGFVLDSELLALRVTCGSWSRLEAQLMGVVVIDDLAV